MAGALSGETGMWYQPDISGGKGNIVEPYERAKDPSAYSVEEPTSYVDEATGTVSGQLGKILESGSPLMQRASSMADLDTSRKGLAGSSMASRAAFGAMVDRATPIAQQDAATYSALGKAQQQFDMEKQIGAQQNDMMNFANSVNQRYTKEIMDKEWDLNTRTLLTGLFGSMSNQFMNEMSAMARTPDVSQTSIDAYKDVYNKQMKSMFDIVSYDNWDWAKV